jgi:hypothetical protein
VRIDWAVAHAEDGSTLAALTFQWIPWFASHRSLIAFGFTLNVFQIWKNTWRQHLRTSMSNGSKRYAGKRMQCCLLAVSQSFQKSFSIKNL